MAVGRKGAWREELILERICRWRAHDWLVVGEGKEWDSWISGEKREDIAVLVLKRLAGVMAMRLGRC